MERGLGMWCGPLAALVGCPGHADRRRTDRGVGEAGEDVRLRRGRTREDWSYAAGPCGCRVRWNPKAGKSTTIDIVTHFFKRMGLKVWAPSEGASKRTPYHLKRDLVAFNTWTLNYAISELLVAFHNVDRHDLILLDRGPFDSIAWMGVLHKRGELGDEELEVYKRFALHPRWSRKIDRVFLYRCDPAVSLQREVQSKLTTAAGTAMNPSMLSDLLEQYDSLESRLREYPVRRGETSDSTTPRGTALMIAEDIVGLLGKRVEHANS